MKLFFDTETTGKADFNRPPNDPCQPRLVQLAAILTDDACDEVGAANLLVKPDGFEIPEAASAIHGITQQTALDAGVMVKYAISIFVGMAKAADTIHAFNLDYDRLVMENEMSRLGNVFQVFSHRRGHCEMLAMKPICKLPGKYNDFKWPKLQEAYRHCFEKDFDGAHDALADVRAMVEIHRWRIRQ